MNQKSFDFAVIGLGALGAAALWQLSKSGKKVLGIDQFSPPHTMGSSHGETRITRLAVGEGADFVPLVMRSHEIWQEINASTNIQIMHQVGGLLLDSGGDTWSKHGSEGFFNRTVNFATQMDIPHKVWDQKKLVDRFPEFNLEPGGLAYFEPSAGYLIPELAVKTQIQLAEKNNAVVKTPTKVLGIAPFNDGVSIHTNQGDFWAARVLLSTGPWVKDFLPPSHQSKFKICRQILHWLPVEAGRFENGKMPVFMWGFGKGAEDFIYGFPSLDGRTVKVASESFRESKHPDTLSRYVSVEEQQHFICEKIAGRLNFLQPKVKESKVCIYTVTDDSYFVVDELPNFPEVIIASPCSGHGFKHSAGLGEAIAQQMVSGRSEVDLTPFRWKV